MNSLSDWDNDSSVARIYLLDGSIAIVDLDDEVRLLEHKWRLHRHRNRNTNYAIANIDRREVLMHRFIFAAERGTIMDHINMNGLDNRKSNLRYASRHQNSANVGKLSIKGGTTSVYKGVYLENRVSQKWRAKIKVSGKKINLGLFDVEVDAAMAYDAAARKHFGEFARPNFP